MREAEEAEECVHEDEITSEGDYARRSNLTET